MILLHFQLFSAFQLEFTSNIQTYACSIYMDCPTFLCAFSRFLRDAIPIFLCQRLIGMIHTHTYICKVHTCIHCTYIRACTHTHTHTYIHAPNHLSQPRKQHNRIERLYCHTLSLPISSTRISSKVTICDFKVHSMLHSHVSSWPFPPCTPFCPECLSSQQSL